MGTNDLPKGVRLTLPTESRLYSISRGADRDEAFDAHLGVMVAGVPYDARFEWDTVDNLLSELGLASIDDVGDQQVWVYGAVKGSGPLTRREVFYGISTAPDSEIHKAISNLSALSDNPSRLRMTTRYM